MTKFNLYSVNQMNAEVKLTDMWKACNDSNYPNPVLKLKDNVERSNTTASASHKLKLVGIKPLTQKTFKFDAGYL